MLNKHEHVIIHIGKKLFLGTIFASIFHLFY
jgi:hypothetical protein